MSKFGTPIHLAPEQLRFAESMQATASVGGANEYGMVFAYREGPQGTERWLVDRRGRVVDHVRFAA
jgi:hypothetical protein